MILMILGYSGVVLPDTLRKGYRRFVKVLLREIIWSFQVQFQLQVDKKMNAYNSFTLVHGYC